MARCTVVWDREVESAFIDAWVDGDSERRAILREIANWIDMNLADIPEEKGQPGLDLARVVAIPLSRSAARASVAFHVFPNDRLANHTSDAPWRLILHRSRATALCRKHVTKWSLTMPTACMWA
jgi:hypothetical protein